MNISEVIDKVQIDSKDNILLCIEEFVPENKIKEVKHEGLTKNRELFISGRHYNDIPKGKVFNVIFSYNEPKNYIEFKTKTVSFSMRKDQYLDMLPEGYGGGVLIDFYGQERPELLSVLNDKSNYNALYLTTQPVMDRILELLNE